MVKERLNVSVRTIYRYIKNLSSAGIPVYMSICSELYQGGVSSKIKNKVNEYAISLYSDYHDDRYEVTVGNEVSKYL